MQVSEIIDLGILRSIEVNLRDLGDIHLEIRSLNSQL